MSSDEVPVAPSDEGDGAIPSPAIAVGVATAEAAAAADRDNDSVASDEMPVAEPTSEEAAAVESADDNEVPAALESGSGNEPPPESSAPSADDDEPSPVEHFWYVLKVQSNREDSIKEAIARRIKIAGLDRFVKEIVVPTEKVSEIKAGKRRVTERKFFPGYIMTNLELNDDVWHVIRETPGVGDFVGSGRRPLPMTEIDIAKMMGKAHKEELPGEQPKLKISFKTGDRVKIKEGPFENLEGDVHEVNETNGLVRVMIQIFGRATPVELEYWKVEKV